MSVEYATEPTADRRSARPFAQAKIMVELSNCRVAFAHQILKLLPIQNTQSATLVLNNSLSLQISSCGGHGGPVGAEHHGEEIVRHVRAIRSLIGHQKPARHSSADLVKAIASCGLSNLHGLYGSKSVGQHLQGGSGG